MAFLPTKILSIGMALPETTITNEDLTSILDTSDEWIATRTGIKERNVLSGEENSTTLAITAAKDALKKAKLTGKDIDLIIVAVSFPYNIYPSTACEVQNAIGGKQGVAFDISAACTGMLYALQVGRSMLSTGQYKTALIIATDQNSRFVDWTDRSTCILFGDGAGAIILTQSDDGIDDILALDVTADGTQGHNITSFLTGGEGCPLTKHYEPKNSTIYMNGKEVYKFVVSTVPDSVEKSIVDAGLKPKDIDYLIPHQANLRIIEGLQSRLEYNDEKVVTNIHKHGNTSAASIPIAMCEGIKEGKIKLPSTAILTAFGAGLTWGSAVVRLREDIY